MKIRSTVLAFLFSTICSTWCIGQGTIQMLNGKEKRYMTYKIQDEYILFQPEYSEPDSWSKRLDRFNVFSIKPDNGAEIVVYDPDTTDGLEPNVEEARQFIAGEKLAIGEYRKPLNVITGIGIGIGSGFAQYFGIPVPVIYSAAIGRVSPRLPKAHRDLQYSESFVAGYEKKARTMKINKSLLGGGIGFAVGFTAFALFLAD
ncbi:MAG: hypothetical protein ACKOGP_01795, partial [Bacteroidota bacterium]